MDAELYSSRPVTTLTLLRFSGGRRAWMLAQMGFGRMALGRASGLRFWKLMGTGHGLGFSLRPNFSCYAILAAWGDARAAQAFLHDSRWMRAVRRNADEAWTVFLLAASARGTWNGRAPFEAGIHPVGGPIAVLTRATIRWRRLRAFWSAVPAASDALEHRAGLLLSTGIGETPLWRQATFSLWRSEDDIRAFAYKSAAHADAIRRTYGEDWYAEELFARFAPIASEGTWGGRDPLA